MKARAKSAQPKHIDPNRLANPRPLASLAPGKTADGDVWRQIGGIYYPERHVPFHLAGDGFGTHPTVRLPSAKSLRKLAECVPRLRELADAAKQASQWEENGGATLDDFYEARRLIDKVLLCSAVDSGALPILAWIVEYALAQMANLVAERDSVQAATQLYSLLAAHVERLNGIAEKLPKLFQPLAHQLPAFPIMGSKFKQQQLDNEHLLTDLLDVGRDYWLQQHRKRRIEPASKAARAKEIATTLIDYLQKYRIVYSELFARADKLPDWTKKLKELERLSPKTWRTWFALGWEIVLETTQDKPAEVDSYRQIARRLHRPDAYGGNVDATHAAIKEALHDAFRELAEGVSSRTSQRRKRPD